MPKKIWILLAFAALYVIWGSTYLTIRFAIETMPPFLMAGARFLIAGIIMYAAARIGGAPKPEAATWRSATIIGGCLLLCGNGGVSLAEQWVPSGIAALLVATVPIYIALLGWLSGTMPRPTGWTWLGLLGGFTGVGVLVGPAFRTSGNVAQNHFALGTAILLFGSFLWSVGSLYSRRSQNARSLFVAAAQQMICGGILLTIVGCSIGEFRGFDFHRISAHSLGSFIYLVLIGALLGYTAYFFLLRHCDPAKVATYAYVNPIVAIILGRIFADEKITARIFWGAGLIIASVAIVIMTEQLRARNKPTAAVIAPAEYSR